MHDRERRFLLVVQALSAADGKLIAFAPRSAVIGMPDGTYATVLLAGDDRDAMAEHLSQVSKDNASLSLKFVIVGGGEWTRELLSSLQPGLFSRRVIQVFALSDAGEVWVGPRSRMSSLMAKTLAKVAADETSPTPDAAELAALLLRPTEEERRAAAEQRRFIARVRGGFPKLTFGLVASCGLAFALEASWGGTEYAPTLVRMGANTEAALGSEPWRLLSYAWLHAGPLHFIVNGYVLWALGGFLERLLGWRQLLILYVASAVGGGVASAWFSQASLSVGASGAIWGLLGASAALTFAPSGLIPAAMIGPLRRSALINVAINLGVSFLPQVDIMAHVGGGLVGAGLMWLVGKLPQRDPPGPGWLSTVAAWSCGGLLAASFVVAQIVGKPWQLMDISTELIEIPDTGLDVRLPLVLGQPSIERSAGATVVRAGDVLKDGAAVVVTIEPLTYELTPAEVDAAFAAAAAANGAEADDAPAGVRTTRRVHIGGRSTLERRERFENGIEILSWSQFGGGHTIVFEAAFWSEHEGSEPQLRAMFGSLVGDEVSGSLAE